MPSLGLHLAITNEYLKLNNNENKDEFIKGTIDVDLAADPSKSHYSIITNANNVVEILKNKVSLKDFKQHNVVNSSYEKGYFLHLLSDYYFNTQFFEKRYLNSFTIINFKELLYKNYSYINEHLKEKFKIVFPDTIKMYDITNVGKSDMLPLNKIDAYISKMANLNLEKEYKKI